MVFPCRQVMDIENLILCEGYRHQGGRIRPPRLLGLPETLWEEAYPAPFTVYCFLCSLRLFYERGRTGKTCIWKLLVITEALERVCLFRCYASVCSILFATKRVQLVPVYLEVLSRCCFCLCYCRSVVCQGSWLIELAICQGSCFFESRMLDFLTVLSWKD